jgi:hypothetical protein
MNIYSELKKQENSLVQSIMAFSHTCTHPHMMISEGTELFHATSLSSITRVENISEKNNR